MRLILPSQTWGITIAANVLQSQLKSRLPASFTAQFPAGVELAFSAIPAINGLEEPLRSEVRAAFALSLSRVWWTMLGFSFAGGLASLAMRELPMQQVKDDKYGLEADAGADAAVTEV